MNHSVPEDGIMVGLATWTHELYLSLVHAGFTPRQSLFMVTELLIANTADEEEVA